MSANPASSYRRPWPAALSTAVPPGTCSFKNQFFSVSRLLNGPLPGLNSDSLRTPFFPPRRLACSVLVFMTAASVPRQTPT